MAALPIVRLPPIFKTAVGLVDPDDSNIVILPELRYTFPLTSKVTLAGDGAAFTKLKQWLDAELLFIIKSPYTM